MEYVRGGQHFKEFIKKDNIVVVVFQKKDNESALYTHLINEHEIFID